MRALHLLPILALAPLGGCMGTVRLPVLQPGAVTIDQSVQKVAVVNRSTPHRFGQGMLEALEGAVTGEGLHHDRDGAAMAVEGAIRALQASPRFEVVMVALTPRELDAGPMDRPADWGLVERICRDAGCDALVALETFDSDSKVSPLNDGEPVSETDGTPQFEVERTSRVVTTWRTYHARERRVLDVVRGDQRESREKEKAASVEEARGKLPERGGAVTALGSKAGEAYGRRIAPSWVHVSRRYFDDGHPDLKAARRALKSGDWLGAIGAWDRLAASPDRKLRGKASFNLALASERTGQLEQALDHARKAHSDLQKKRTRSYVRALEGRIAAEKRLQEQMGTAPAPTGREAGELVPPPL